MANDYTNFNIRKSTTRSSTSIQIKFDLRALGIDFSIKSESWQDKLERFKPSKETGSKDIARVLKSLLSRPASAFQEAQ